MTKRIWYFAFAWLGLLAVTAWTSSGWIQPDEHARVLEPAHYIAYGFASLPWELSNTPNIVSWLLGFIVSPILMLTKYFQLTGMTEAFLVRFFIGLLSSTRLIALMFLFRHFKLKADRHFLYLVIAAFAIFGPMFYVRTSQENFSTTAFIWALVLHFKIVANHDGRTRLTHNSMFVNAFFYAAQLSLATSFRLQMGPTAACLGLYTLYCVGTRIVVPATLGLVAGLAPLAICDFLTTGIPFSPAWHYLQYALGGEEGGAVWGVEPWWFYIQQYFEAWYPPLSIFLLLPLVVGLRAAPALGVIVLSFALVQFSVSHKEARYWSTMIPFLQLATFVGWEFLEKGSKAFTVNVNAWPKVNRTLLAIFVLVGVLGGLIEANTSPAMYQKLGELIRSGEIQSYTYVGNTRTRPSQFYTKVPNSSEQMISMDEIHAATKSPQGWIAFYCIGPDDFKKIALQCDVRYNSISAFELRILSSLPKNTPIRRRINAIAWCKQELHLK